MFDFKKTTLPNGIRVLTERHPSTPAVHVGFWLLTGTRDEKPAQAGISHFLEHMVFKGTKKRTPYQIALALESVGGDINAYTTKEYTCFHTTTLKEHMKLSVDVLTDLVFSPIYPQKEFDKEQEVVLQEISMSKEEYSEYVFDVFLKETYGAHSAGFPILGTEKSVSDMTRKDLMKYAKDRFFGENMIVTVVGNIDHDQVIDELSRQLKHVPKKGQKVQRRKPKTKVVNGTVRAPSEQVHMLYGFETSSYKESSRFESYFMSMLLGGGMTSKLYQELREKRGMAYSIYSYLYTFFDCALSQVYVATDAKKIEKVDAILRRELKKIVDKGVTRAQLKLFRTQMKGQILLSVDDIEGRMTTLAHNEMIFKKQRSTEDVVREIDAISSESLRNYIDEYLNLDKLSLVVMGDLKEPVLGGRMI